MRVPCRRAKTDSRITCPEAELCGTEYPLICPSRIDFTLNATFLSNADREVILDGNAITLLRIPS